MKSKEEILRNHLGQTPQEFQDLGKKNTLEAMEEYGKQQYELGVNDGKIIAEHGTVNWAD